MGLHRLACNRVQLVDDLRKKNPKIFMEILVKYENYEKRQQGTQIDGPIFTTAGDNTLICLVPSLSEYIRQSTQNEKPYVK
jgi:hypothetical protein